MNKTSQPTSDHSLIRLWANSYDAMPAELLPGHVDSIPAQLHFFLPGDNTRQPRLRIIAWEDFFAVFEAHGLSFVYEILADGRPGRRFEILQKEGHASPFASKQRPQHDSDTAVEVAE